mmetsp:Transcript_152725/g.266712  ORF Transcript_152725/g.266712 Transcript_152725/m.266712 type:complete len:219 (-) Transcript_152725:161-817(-)
MRRPLLPSVVPSLANPLRSRDPTLRGQGDCLRPPALQHAALPAPGSAITPRIGGQRRQHSHGSHPPTTRPCTQTRALSRGSSLRVPHHQPAPTRAPTHTCQSTARAAPYPGHTPAPLHALPPQAAPLCLRDVPPALGLAPDLALGPVLGHAPGPARHGAGLAPWRTAAPPQKPPHLRALWAPRIPHTHLTHFKLCLTGWTRAHGSGGTNRRGLSGGWC